MSTVPRSQWWFLLIPALAILIMLPVAIVIGLNIGNEGESESPTEVNVLDKSAQEAGADPAAEVRLVDFAFEPNPIEGRVGRTIPFRNDAATVHQVVIDAETKSVELHQGDIFEWTPSEPGVYEIMCAIHPNNMKATINVAAN